MQNRNTRVKPLFFNVNCNYSTPTYFGICVQHMRPTELLSPIKRSRGLRKDLNNKFRSVVVIKLNFSSMKQRTNGLRLCKVY